MMLKREFLIWSARKAELPVFLSVLGAIPADKIDYTPHERSPNAGQIVWTLTNELLSCIEAATTHRAQWHGEPCCCSTKCFVLFEQCLTMLGDRSRRSGCVGRHHAFSFCGGGGGGGGGGSLVHHVRRDPSPRPAHGLSAADGRRGDPRCMGRRPTRDRGSRELH